MVGKFFSTLGHCMLFLFLSGFLYILFAGALFFSWLYQIPLPFEFDNVIWRILLVLVVLVLPAFLVGLRVYKGKIEQLPWAYCLTLVVFIAMAEFAGLLFIAIAPMKMAIKLLNSDAELPIKPETFVSVQSGVFLLGIAILIGIGFSLAIALRKRQYVKRVAIHSLSKPDAARSVCQAD